MKSPSTVEIAEQVEPRRATDGLLEQLQARRLTREQEADPGAFVNILDEDLSRPLPQDEAATHQAPKDNTETSLVDPLNRDLAINAGGGARLASAKQGGAATLK